LHLPAYNPFLKGKADEEWTDEQYQTQLNNAQTVETPNTELQQVQDLPLNFARDTHLRDEDLLGLHLNDELKHIANIYLMRHGFLNDALIDKVLKDVRAVNESNYELYHNFLRRHQTNAQSHTLSYPRASMVILVNESGG
jgi:hypothetical protein